MGDGPVERAAVDTVKARGHCEAVGLAPGECSGGLEVHELKRGSYWRRECRRFPQAMLLVCRFHHMWITHQPEKARAVGLAWDVRQAHEFFDAAGVTTKVVPR